ncbi:MAG: TIGR00730 family Rossman fold protein [Lentisphaeraceae bacterium]|nr:TIGR00730 family Rossman fold protein [Lentisphaeraceae bacterium]
MKKICVYCGSSKKVDEKFLESARETARVLVKAGYEVVYGGGSIGLMGALADTALEEGGQVTGIIPGFMEELEWGHKKATMINVTGMHARKAKMFEMSDGVIALAGGCGTFEEILEAITWRRLGLFNGPAVILNTDGYYDHLIKQLELSVEEKFMNGVHKDLWIEITQPEEILDALKNYVEIDNPLKSAAVK